MDAYLLFNKNLTRRTIVKASKLYTFVHTNIVDTNFANVTITGVTMKIEDVIRSEQMSLYKKVVMNVMYASNVIGENVNDVMKTYDLSPEQFNVLRILRGQKGKPANMCVIQERMIAKTSNTTRLVDKLLLKGLVSRKVCADNRRKMEIAVTEKGLDLLKELDPAVEENEMKFAKNLSTEELEQLNFLLEKYRTL
jgi:DNA-binding MarR family transcriptional regulator